MDRVVGRCSYRSEGMACMDTINGRCSYRDEGVTLTELLADAFIGMKE